MKGKILSYRRGRRKQNVNQMLIEVENVTSKEDAEKLVGKKLVWETPGGREIKGELIAVHGGKGVLRAKFERNLPGQSITTFVEIEG
ncbi:MAG: 50S ribosomal protein L35ae [Candidatus Aenigmarchaeota archaeon]|nr:50S ribosomal protein L35ae [Candidatus Aenigmarchaeota archaeon]